MRQIDRKYQSTGEIQKLDGTSLPADEPLILFRGHDKVLPDLLRHYNELCKASGSPDSQIQIIEDKIKEIETWQAANSDKVKAAD